MAVTYTFAGRRSPVDVAEIDTNFSNLDTAVTALQITVPATGNIKFPATQNASADANTLDDYEEGTWTPTLTFATPGDLSVTYSSRIGIYTKIGRMVYITFWVSTSAFTHTTASGTCSITGLPFTSSSATFGGAGLSQWNGVTKANYTDIGARIATSSSSFVFQASGSGQVSSSLAAADIPTGGSLVFIGSFHYNV